MYTQLSIQIRFYLILVLNYVKIETKNLHNGQCYTWRRIFLISIDWKYNLSSWKVCDFVVISL